MTEAARSQREKASWTPSPRSEGDSAVAISSLFVADSDATFWGLI
jgi:hypothetical protein